MSCNAHFERIEVCFNNIDRFNYEEYLFIRELVCKANQKGLQGIKVDLCDLNSCEDSIDAKSKGKSTHVAILRLTNQKQQNYTAQENRDYP